jgi:DNA invertase Pin-like site-specific DNA recombinase
MKYAFAYLRVSTEEQTVQNQKLALEKWGKLNGYLILDYFEDPAISGKIPATQRRGFQEMNYLGLEGPFGTRWMP